MLLGDGIAARMGERVLMRLSKTILSFVYKACVFLVPQQSTNMKCQSLYIKWN
jgi:hypothetical protein